MTLEEAAMPAKLYVQRTSERNAAGVAICLGEQMTFAAYRLNHEEA